MYAFGPIPRQKRTGRVIGTHQKIDRVARRHFDRHIDSLAFPAIVDILHFEGSRGPDGAKLKSPGRDEPWHFIDPGHINDSTPLLITIRDHQYNLSQALIAGDTIRAAFEAAWLAHAVTDGLTPAHHEPLEEQLQGIRHSDERSTKVRSKFAMASNGSKRQFVKNNWSYWGAKGIMTTHTLFEAGVATAAKPLSFKVAAATDEDIQELATRGFQAIYIDMVQAVDELGMYERFRRDGWTTTLARQTTKKLIPTIIHAVELAWLEAYNKAMKERSSMNIRIISGKYGGRVVDAPDRSSTHAMSERARNALFNSIAAELPGTRVLDAFAGSGSLGVEAMSRGASEVVFIEKDRIAAKIIQKNIDMLNIENAKVIKTSVSNWLNTSEDEGFDVIFADPPYHDTQFSTVKRLFGLLKSSALMVLSHPGKGEVPSKTGVVVVDNRSYGNLNLTLYRLEGAE